MLAAVYRVTMYSGQIIDTHMHLWDIANGYAWLSHVPKGLPDRFFMNDYLKMSQHQPISQMVHIECGGFPHNPVLETQWVQSQADLYGGPQAIAAFVPLDSTEAAMILRGHAQYPHLRSIRMPLNCVAGGFGADRDDYMRDPAWQKGYALLAKYELPFEMQIFDTQIPDAVHLANAFPDIPILLQHLGWPLSASRDDLLPWKERMALLAECSNVFLKLSGMGWIFQSYDESLMISYLQEAVRLFGPDRCMVGSNCPPDTLFLSFDMIFTLFKKALASYSLLDQQKIFYSNAKRIYRI